MRPHTDIALIHFQDDKHSLAELHSFLNDDSSHWKEDEYPNGDAVDRLSTSSSVRSSRAERRRSLPLRSSSASLASQYTITSPAPEQSEFQVRRRRVAKLSHFFGANYRDLLGEILASLEMGVKEDGGKGTLRPDEVQVRSSASPMSRAALT